jgi:hypothetical protein
VIGVSAGQPYPLIFRQDYGNPVNLMPYAGSASAPQFAAVDVPALRRELADFYGGPQGVMYYGNAIALGRQQNRPPGPPARVAGLLAGAEAMRLREGDLWHVDEDLCALVNAAHSNMPIFAPRPSDLPSLTGFAVFANPIAVYPYAESRHDDLAEQLERRGNDASRRMTAQMESADAAIVAVSWSPVRNPHWPAGGVWMSFYAASWVNSDDAFEDPAVARRARAMLPTLTVDNEATFAWRPEGAPAEQFQLPTVASDRGTLGWARLVFASFQLAVQANLAETQEVATPRPERRRAQRSGLPDRDVRVMRLRRSVAAARDAEADGDGREWHHRWVVRGHLRPGMGSLRHTIVGHR